MAVYLVLFLSGLAGLGAMALLGLVGGHHTHETRHSIDSHGSGHSVGAVPPPGGHSHAPAHLGATHPAVSHGHGHGHGGDAEAQSDGDGDSPAQSLGGLAWLMPFLSPLNWFSWLIGAGAAGLLAGSAGVHEPLT